MEEAEVRGKSRGEVSCPGASRACRKKMGFSSVGVQGSQSARELGGRRWGFLIPSLLALLSPASS